MPAIMTERSFATVQRLLYEIAGIHLAPGKRLMVAGRLSKRLRARGLDSYEDYLALLTSTADPQELQTAVDLLTTNETYFFREPKHFDFLRESILPAHPSGQPFRVWSAACSSGEEPYSIAMMLADVLGQGAWSVLGTDLSTQVLEKARAGVYPLGRAKLLPEAYMKRYCLRGTRDYDGSLLVERGLRERVELRQLNLNQPFSNVGPFELVFLRNVMIYFSSETKRAVIERIAQVLRPGGYLFIGHSESLNGMGSGLEAVQPAIYRKPG